MSCQCQCAVSAYKFNCRGIPDYCDKKILGSHSYL
uniref:Uncharacterized protein n=1 Tax=Anguilla anguilla TaxID=7936 RepID=A0A0E9VSB2_ANGAN